ncbi:MAG TPA: hypothetical protein VFP98_10710, partial [Candidatus Polarisedimenticolia bacterium]|nr:hypothetical protein [Candidatus Polarisedimenticolia bacterium]
GFTLQSFGATTPQTQIRDEIEGAGVSGPYRLSRAPVVINSERVILETRDRFQPDRVLSSTGMARFTDYDVDYRNGTLLFKRPVAFQDDGFNPVVLVVIYETLDGDGNQTVAGGRAGYRFGDTGEIGMTYVNEDRTGGAFVLRGADFRVRRAFGSSSMEFGGEAAASESAAGEPAGAVAFRASARLGQAMTIGAHYRNVASGFENPSRAGLPDAGTIRWGLEATASLAGGSRLKGELYSQQDDVRGQDRRVAAVDWERPIGRFTARSGLKELHALDPASGRVESSRLISAGAGFRIGRRLEGLLARQQVVSGPALAEYPTRTSVGLGWQVTEEVRAFLRQELDQADAGSSARTVIGMESRLTRHTVMESRYSIEDALSGSRGAAHLGLRTRLPLNQDWLGDAGIERVATAHGLSTADFTSLRIGFEYLPARVKFTTRYELRLGTLDDRHVLTLGGATRVTDSLNLFARQRLFVVNPADSGARFDGDGLVGLAYRPVEDDRLNFLVKLQGLKGDGALSAGSPGARSYLGVFEANYQPVLRLHLMARAAIKHSRDVFEGDSYTSSSRLLEGRLLYDIRTRYNAGLSVRRLDQPGSGSIVTGFGIEGGYNLVRDLWFVGGFNVTGFAEPGFGDSDRRAAGPFLTVRFKFDEESLVGLAGRFSSTPNAGRKAAGLRRLR